MKESMFYKKLPKKLVKCELCPHFCVIPLKGRGNCGVRENRKGKLVSLVYNKAISANIDPIEKKPLFHFAPGSECLSVATMGCNLHCSFCQNWEISQIESEVMGQELEPERIVDIAIENNVPGIAYTYTEPTIFYEYALDTMKLARKAGLYNIWVSNGYTNPEPAKEAAKYLDAINVDMKGDIKFYQRLCGVPNEEPIKEALKIYKKAGVWIEVTNLVVPGFNDHKNQVKKLVQWIKENLGDIPLHFSRFHPIYKLANIATTPQKTLEMCYETAKEIGMNWVYVGNIISGHDGESTKCPGCGRKLIEREGFETLTFKSRCDKCAIEVPLGGKKWMTKLTKN
jgi:pyruvate formate lyase activating enzyme